MKINIILFLIALFLLNACEEFQPDTPLWDANAKEWKIKTELCVSHDDDGKQFFIPSFYPMYKDSSGHWWIAEQYPIGGYGSYRIHFDDSLSAVSWIKKNIPKAKIL
jgi:hypothetical protein